MNENDNRFDLNAKILCVLTGSFAGIVGVVAGLVVGHMVDRFIHVRHSSFSGKRRQTEKRMKPAAGEMSLPEARKILDVRDTTKPEEIRRVYRKLASGFHPDTAEALDPAQRKQLTEAFIRIRSAYERIMGNDEG